MKTALTALPAHKFTDSQLTQLFLRLRQTKEELLFDADALEVARYRLRYKSGEARRGQMILGVAHCDYVESAWSYPQYLDDGIDNRRCVQAGQVDDRVGVWLLLDVLPTMLADVEFDVLLTTDEECGQSSASEVTEALNYNWVFQFDRRGTDFVDYGLASQKFIKAFKRTTGIAHGMGSFSDICSLDDGAGSRVNIGTGYYNEHSPDAHVDLAETWQQVTRFCKFANKYAETAFPVAQRRRRKSIKRASSYSENWGTLYKDDKFGNLDDEYASIFKGDALDSIDLDAGTMRCPRCDSIEVIRKFDNEFVQLECGCFIRRNV